MASSGRLAFGRAEKEDDARPAVSRSGGPSSDTQEPEPGRTASGAVAELEDVDLGTLNATDGFESSESGGDDRPADNLGPPLIYDLGEQSEDELGNPFAGESPRADNVDEEAAGEPDKDKADDQAVYAFASSDDNDF
jgi:hypothetical protein